MKISRYPCAWSSSSSVYSSSALCSLRKCRFVGRLGGGGGVQAKGNSLSARTIGGWAVEHPPKNSPSVGSHSDGRLLAPVGQPISCFT